MIQLLVLAKEPQPGRVKTRLCPPYFPAEAAALAAAALADTLATVAATPAARRVLVIEGDIAAPSFDVVPQRGSGLDERLAAAFTDAYAGCPLPMLLVGMDTPQIQARMLSAAARTLLRPAVDAVFGPATDGGFWALGLRRPNPGLLLGVPMSRADTGDIQLSRLHAAGLRVALLPLLTDVDDAGSADRVAAAAPGSRFAAALDRLAPERAS